MTEAKIELKIDKRDNVYYISIKKGDQYYYQFKTIEDIENMLMYMPENEDDLKFLLTEFYIKELECQNLQN